MTWPMLEDRTRLALLEPPRRRVRAVLDTDAFNQIDDQFAVAYAVLSRDRIDLQAMTAAPFHNRRSDGPADGMRKSYDEILRLLERMRVEPGSWVHHGSTAFLPDARTPIKSNAAERIVDLAMNGELPLYVLAIGAITNVASAILLAPQIAGRVVVVWLGGQAQQWFTANEFNLRQDVHAARVLFDSGVPLLHVPCRNAAIHLRTTVAEIEQHVRGTSRIGDYLADIFREHVGQTAGRSKVLWDIAAVAWLVNDDWVKSSCVHAPILNDNLTWSQDRNRHLIREAWDCDRDAIYADLFDRLAQ